MAFSCTMCILMVTTSLPWEKRQVQVQKVLETYKSIWYDLGTEVKLHIRIQPSADHKSTREPSRKERYAWVLTCPHS